MNDLLAYEFSFCGGITRHGTIKRTLPNVKGRAADWCHYDLDDDCLVLPLGCHITSEMADLIDVCLAVAMCDRRAPRDPRDRERRIIEVLIPVRRPEIWNLLEVRQTVVHLLEMLTGDIWIIRFALRRHQARQVSTQLSFNPSPSVVEQPVVALHSGGLDSLLGMAEVLGSNESAAVVPVSIVTITKTRRLINAVTASLQRAFPDARLHGCQIRLLHHRIDDIDDRESSYRARILPCLAAGVVVAAALGSGQFQLTENGPGAINLPSSPEQLDAWTTRATHPKTLAEFANLATLVLDHEIHIVNTGLFKTKGQLAAVLQDSRFEEAASMTVSCERFPYANANAPCGSCMSCLSCLYRQMALDRAGMAHLDAERIARRNERLTIAAEQRRGIESSALALHLEHLKSLLSAADPYRELDAEYERIDEVVQGAESLGIASDHAMSAIVALYREFTAEADAFLRANVSTFPQPKECAVAS